MKIVCTKENLQKGLLLVSSVVKKITTLPILSNVLISTEGGRIKLATTNLEIGITCFIRGKVDKEGKTTVPAHLILGFVNNLPPSKILLELKDDVLNLECESFKAKIKCLNPLEFPLIPKIEEKPLCNVLPEDLQKALSQVVFATAIDESRPELTGVFMKLEKSIIRLAATDSYRLTERIIKFKNESAKEINFILPHQTASEILRILTKNLEGEVEIYSLENQIKFKTGDVELVSRLIDGQYPDYVKIIPEKFTTKFKVNSEEFFSALRSAGLFSKVDGNEVEINVAPKQGEIRIQSESVQTGSDYSVLRGKGEGREEKIVFNYQYILEGLQACDSDFVNLLLSGDIGPAAIKPENDEGYIYIIMPIKK